MSLEDSHRIALARELTAAAGVPLRDRYGFAASDETVLYVVNAVFAQPDDKRAANDIGCAGAVGDYEPIPLSEVPPLASDRGYLDPGADGDRPAREVAEEMVRAMEEDRSDCPFYQYSRNDGPYGTCNRGCWSEPSCITDEPIDGWPAIRSEAGECRHDEDELDTDDHRAGCLNDPAAAERLERRESFWDSQGVSGYEL